MRVYIGKLFSVVGVLFLALAVFSCVTGGEQLLSGQNGEKTSVSGEISKEQTHSNPSGSVEKNGSLNTPENNADVLYKLRELFQNGVDKIYQGAISDGIKQLVSVLAEGKKITNPNEEIKSIISEAETTLEKLSASLTMQAGSEWIDKNKNQITVSTLNIGTKKTLQPSVVLVYSSGSSGSIVVSNAPIVFRFVKGSGLLTGFVTTNDYGKANCSIAKFDNPQEENVIRAMLVYRVKGYTYTFENVKRDFVYTPPSRKATILVMEKSKLGISENPFILDSVYGKIKDVGFDLSEYNGVLLGSKFMRVFGGDPFAINELGLKKEISYIVMVLNDCYYLKQVELNGKKYNIYRSMANATTRIIRISDGKIMYSGSVQGVKGQGNNEEKSVEDALKKAAKAMGEKLERDFPEIKSVLLGD